jgi:dolichol-phosphate mannosyltransferase
LLPLESSRAGQDEHMLTVVVPCFNEEAVLGLLMPRLRSVLDSLGHDYEVIFVDDGSRDRTRAILLETQAAWPQVLVRALTSNAGHQAALTAGMDASRGDYVVTMDADLQDPPELIPDMLAEARRNGLDVVYARRRDRQRDTFFKRRTAALYYRLVRWLTQVDLQDDAGDFRLISRRVVDVLKQLPERDRVYRLLIPWLGFPAGTVTYARDVRAAGTTKYPLPRMIALAVSSATAFSTKPLRAATAVGLATALGSLIATVATMLDWVAGNTVPGWASLTCVLLFLGAVQLLCLGLLGEYIGRIYQQVQNRPIYQIEQDIRLPQKTS